nr:MAG TPA: hypothetical protein [Caudoviricetes sp.]
MTGWRKKLTLLVNTLKNMLFLILCQSQWT